MLLRNLLGILLLGSVVAGCSISESDAPTSSVPPSTGIEVSSLGETSLRVRWKGALEEGTAYGVHWEAMTDRSDSGFHALADTVVVIDRLRPGVSYLVEVTAYRGGRLSAPIPGSTRRIVWATARHYVTEQSTNAIRIYETGSNVGSGLLLDTLLGGPRNINMKTPTVGGRSQLAIYTTPGDTTSFKIGPAFSFSSYRTQYAVDTNIFISRTTLPVPGLDAWYSSASIDELIDPNGNMKAYTLPARQPDSMGQGFYVRTGRPGDYHYARVFVVNVGGALLQGGAPDRFVQLEISYQPAPNLPYAKAAGGAGIPIEARREGE